MKRWANLPPNNTLLSDQNYRKIWNAWNELRDLDMDIRKYSEESEACKRIDIVDNLKKILKAREIIIYFLNFLLMSTSKNIK